MTALRLLLLGVAALAASVVATPEAKQRKETLTSAVSRSLGGLRVFIVDVMFLRAEQARAEGDIAEAARLYEALLQMQPDNAPAAAHLVDIEFDNLGYVLDADERFEGWKRLRRRVAQLIELQPSSALLRYRDAQLVLKVLRGKDAALKARVAQLPEPRFQALMATAEACGLAETIRGLGSHHLDTFAFLATEVAADGLARDREAVWGRAVDLGRAILDLRREMLTEHRHQRVDDPDPTNPKHWIVLADLLSEGLDAVEAIAAAGSRPQAEAALARFTDRAGSDLQAVPLLKLAIARMWKK